MRGRLLAVACLLVLAGCSGASTGGPEPTGTVTPVPVPATETPERGVSGPDGPGIEDGVVDGSALASRHDESLAVPYRRVVVLRVEAGDGTLLTYRENRTVADGGSVQRRTYEGPLTTRFVPGSRNATTARTVRFDDGTGETRIQFVDGTEREDAAPLVAPVVPDSEANLAPLLDGAVVDSRNASREYRVSKDRVPGAAVPGFLADVRNGSVRASVRRVGRITRLTVRYDARVGGRQVAVIQEVRWTQPVNRELR